MSVVKEVHLCPILMRTVIWKDGQCSEPCSEEDCPIDELENDKIRNDAHSALRNGQVL